MKRRRKRKSKREIGQLNNYFFSRPREGESPGKL